MLILSHRGYWKENEEKNTAIAFERSFALGFGTELDVRDYCGNLVVSHDIPGPDSLLFKNVLDIYCGYDKNLFLAINIKSDGLQGLLLDILKEYEIKNYFLFDMSVPEALGYIQNNFNVFTRESEYERSPSYYERADGVWMDEFTRHWICMHNICYNLEEGKNVCIVSPELHKRNHLPVWEEYRMLIHVSSKNTLMLCTDYPEEAKEFFYD